MTAAAKTQQQQREDDAKRRELPKEKAAAEPEWRTRHKHWRGTPGGETALAAGPARRPCAQGARRRSGFGAKKSSVVAVFVFVFIFVFIFLVHVKKKKKKSGVTLRRRLCDGQGGEGIRQRNV